MQLRVFTGADRQAAMAAMRDALGEDAILVDSREENGGFRITAARDTGEADLTTLLAKAPAQAVQHPLIEWLIAFHRPSTEVATRLRRQPVGEDDGDGRDETVAAQALRGLLKFSALPWPQQAGVSPTRTGHAGRPLLLVGLPGSGKTTVAARLALMARQAGVTPEILSHGDQRAGGFAQLQALLAPMKLRATICEEAAGVLADDQPAVIDTLGVNPFSLKEMTALAQTIAQLRATPLLVIDAQSEAADAAEIAGNFAAIGVRHALVTRLDLCRRMGSVLALAAADLRLVGATVSPLIAKPVMPLNATGVARLALRQRETGKS